MNKQDLIAHIAETASVSHAKASAAVNAMIDALSEALAQGDSVTLTGFGTFSVGARAARQGRNPATGQAIEIPACKAPQFKAGKTLKAAVNG